jgi:RecT family
MNELITQNNKSTSVFDADQFNHWMDVVQKLSKSNMIPKSYIGKPMDMLVAIDMGKQVGLGTMQSLQSIAVINGMPSMYSDAPLAVCQSHPSFEWIKEEPITIDNGEITGYSCIVKRRNHEPHTYSFTINDAKKAGLWGKQGPWSQYPARMLQMRARGFALRNTFPDALKGIQIAEEVQDIQVINGQWEPKQSQSDKMNLLLAKKGINHDQKATSNVINASDISHDTGLCSANSNPSEHASETDVRPGLAENGESKDCDTVTQNVPKKCSTEQLDIIACAMHEKGFDDARKIKALRYFEVDTFEQLTEDQGEAMISMIAKAE